MNKLHSIHAVLREKIQNGSFKEGERLPTTNELALSFECSVGMAGKAIAMLVHEGLVEQRRGLGTRVLKRTPAGPSGTALDAFAFIYSSDKHEGIWRTVSGFQSAASERQRRVVTLSTGTDYFKEIEYLNRLTEFDVRGAVIYPTMPSLQDRVQISKILAESKFPVVLVDLNLPGLGCPSVVVDGFHAGYVMTRYLLAKGLKRIGFFANHSWAPSVVDRYHGYCWALEEAKIPLEGAHVMLEPSMNPDFEHPLDEPAALAHAYLGRGDLVEGVVCANDYLAGGMLRAARERGLSVPKKLKVAGIDGFALHLEGEVPLTSYRVSFEQMGRKAFEILNALLNKETQLEQETRIRGEIVVRESA